jgi:hypothetical protein
VEKISERIKARSQVTLEKSSKNYISLFGGKPARGLPTPHPQSSAQSNRTFHTWRAGKCDPRTRFLLAEFTRGGGGGGDAKQRHSLTNHRINCKLKTKIANNILLLCYFDKICLSPSGGLWKASANLYCEEKL